MKKNNEETQKMLLNRTLLNNIRNFTVNTAEIACIGFDCAILIGALREYCNENSYTKATVEEVEKWCGIGRNKQTAAIKKLEELNMIETLYMGLPRSRHIRLLSGDEEI